MNTATAFEIVKQRTAPGDSFEDRLLTLDALAQLAATAGLTKECERAQRLAAQLRDIDRKQMSFFAPEGQG